MPELAEVEYFRHQWDSGLRKQVVAVELHAEKRIFRGSDTEALVRTLTGARMLGSEARGKQMLFRFSPSGWLGIHLGMSGSLRCESGDYAVQKHDHLVLRGGKQTLVYRDARMFGRIRFAAGKVEPEWWSALPPALTSPEFTATRMREIVQRRGKAPLKAVLLNQTFFPGVGNWMADEILWQARISPRTAGQQLTAPEMRRLHQKTQAVCRTAMETIGVDWSDPPKDWLIHVRWKRGGKCPRDRRELERATVGGRTTAWCAKCQPEK